MFVLTPQQVKRLCASDSIFQLVLTSCVCALQVLVIIIIFDLTTSMLDGLNMADRERRYIIGRYFPASFIPFFDNHV